VNTRLLRSTPTRQAAAAGARDIAPLLVSLVPFGLAIGVAVAASPLDDAVGWATGPLLFSGASQLTAIDLLGSGAGAVTVVATVLVLNARFALYGAALAPRFAGQPAWFRRLAPYFVVDPLVATVSDPPPDGEGRDWWRWHYLGAAAALFVTWVGAITVGMATGPGLDEAWGLDFAAPLCLVALLARRLRDRDAVTAAGVGAAAAMLVYVVPAGIAVLVAMVAGTSVAALTNRSTR
jgi:predicted branched-subunit amino acid permease